MQLATSSDESLTLKRCWQSYNENKDWPSRVWDELGHVVSAQPVQSTADSSSSSASADKVNAGKDAFASFWSEHEKAINETKRVAASMMMIQGLYRTLKAPSRLIALRALVGPSQGSELKPEPEVSAAWPCGPEG